MDEIPPEQKLKTLHLDSGVDWRGGQNQVFLLCGGLVEEGHEVALVTPPASMLSRRLERQDVRIFEIPQRGGFAWRAALSVRRIIRETKPDLVHAHTAHAHSTALLALGRSTEPPLFITRRVDFAIGRNHFSRRKYLHPACRYVAISNGVREALERGGVAPELIHLAPSGVDPQKFTYASNNSRLRRELDFPQDTFVVGNVGALVDHKDHATLLKAAKIVTERDPKVIFLIIGKGELMRPLLRQIDKLDLRRYVRLLGQRRDIEACLAGFELFVMSSHMEGLCTSIIDAMLMSVPVVATRTGGIPDIVRDRETGLLVPPRNPEQLAAAILEMKQSPELRNECAQRAKTMALAQFSAKKMVAKTIEAYYSLRK
jgi:glycosyltransferase involved in cell wall biosynthesis